MDCSTLGFLVHHRLLELTQTQVHWVDNAIQPSHPLSSLSPLTFNLSQHQGLFKWVSSSHQVAKVLEFQLQHQSFQSILRTDFFWDGQVCSNNGNIHAIFNFYKNSVWERLLFSPFHRWGNWGTANNLCEVLVSSRTRIWTLSYSTPESLLSILTLTTWRYKKYTYRSIHDYGSRAAQMESKIQTFD